MNRFSKSNSNYRKEKYLTHSLTHTHIHALAHTHTISIKTYCTSAIYNVLAYKFIITMRVQTVLCLQSVNSLYHMF